MVSDFIYYIEKLRLANDSKVKNDDLNDWNEELSKGSFNYTSESSIPSIYPEIKKVDTVNKLNNIVNDYLISKLLNNYDTVISDPYLAVFYSIKYEVPVPEAEWDIARVPELSYLYARYGIGERFYKGESIISCDPTLSVRYAEKVIRGRFDIAEDAISLDSRLSHHYARHCILSRFEVGENAIFQDRDLARNYMEYVVVSRCPKYERLIYSNGRDSSHYAFHVISERFELGEPAIMSVVHRGLDYWRKFVRPERSGLLENTLVGYPSESLDYVFECNSGRIPILEETILKSPRVDEYTKYLMNKYEV